MSLIMEKYRQCYMKKTVSNKFSAKNNMNSDDVPDELKGLTEVEEMLIT